MNKYLAFLDEAWNAHLTEKKKTAPTVISTFAGCGGSSLGYSMAGFQERLAVEWDDHAVQTFKLNFPHVPVFHGDIAAFSVEQALETAKLKPGELSVFDGSPPCQGFSSAGHRILDDPRNQLFREFIRLLNGLRPRVFVMENVSGMVKGQMKGIFTDALWALRDQGYTVEVRLLNAKYFYVPQNRQRIIFIGVRDDLKTAPAFPRPISGPIPCQIAFEGLPSDETPTLRGQGLYLWERTVPGNSFSKTHPKGHWFNSTKLSPRKPAATCTKMCSPSAMGLFHWEAPRILSISEVKRISSFPDGFKFEGAFVDQWARMGNCVPPLLMKAVAETIRKEIL